MTESVKNISDKPARITLAGKPGEAPTVHDLKPGDTCDVPAGYCNRIIPIGGGNKTSTVEKQTRGSVVPVKFIEGAPKKVAKKPEVKAEPKAEAKPAPKVESKPKASKPKAEVKPLPKAKKKERPTPPPPTPESRESLVKKAKKAGVKGAAAMKRGALESAIKDKSGD